MSRIYILKWGCGGGSSGRSGGLELGLPGGEDLLGPSFDSRMSHSTRNRLKPSKMLHR